MFTCKFLTDPWILLQGWVILVPKVMYKWSFQPGDLIGTTRFCSIFDYFSSEIAKSLVVPLAGT